MSRRPPYVEWYAADFLGGIGGLNAIEIAVYSVILNMIYDAGAAIPYDPARLARRCGGVRVDHFKRAIENLVALDKLMIVDGVISNKRCESELRRRTEKIKKLTGNFNGRDGARKENVTLKEQRLADSNSELSANAKSKNVNGNNGAHAPNGHGFGTPNGGEIQIQKKDRESQGREFERGSVATAPPQPSSARARSRARASRIDTSWKPSNDQVLFARSLGLTANEVGFEAQKFLSHYRAAPGDRGLSNDWDATWQTWVLRTAERLGRSMPVNHHHQDALQPQNYSRAEWERVISVWRTTDRWNMRDGPPPGEPGCLAPPDLVNHS